MKACIINHGRDLSLTLGSLSDFGTFETVIIESFFNYRREAVARNKYLRNLKDGEWFLSIDSDEALESPIDESALVGKTALVMMKLADDDYCLVPRLIRYEEGMRYVTHYLIGKDKTYYNLSFVSSSFNKKSQVLSYAGRIRHLRKRHTNEELVLKEAQRREEKRTEKKMRSKGVIIVGFH